jgi:branched-chain amino acid transport system ATP-binding protein
VSAKPVIEVEQIDVFYGTSQILFGVSLSVSEGQTVALLGRNGAGKSTTLKAIAGLVAPRAGRVRVLGIEMQNRRPHAIARAGVGFVPEDRQIFPEHTVEDNLLLGAKKGRNGEDYWNLKRVYSMFPLLEPLKQRMGGTLSGGEQQMLTIARTLMGNPDVVLLDEPTEGLSPIMVKTLKDLILKLKELNTTILLSEQNAKFAMAVADRVMIIDKGHIRYKSDIESFKQDSHVQKIYLAL